MSTGQKVSITKRGKVPWSQLRGACNPVQSSGKEGQSWENLQNLEHFLNVFILSKCNRKLKYNFSGLIILHNILLIKTLLSIPGSSGQPRSTRIYRSHPMFSLSKKRNPLQTMILIQMKGLMIKLKHLMRFPCFCQIGDLKELDT